MGEFRTDCYLAIKQQVEKEHPEAHIENITRRAGSVLSPSWEMLKPFLQKLKSGKYDEDELWEEYEAAFLQEMRDNFEVVHAKLEELREIVKTKDVYLVCVEANRNVEENEHCHRFIVKKMLEREIVL